MLRSYQNVITNSKRRDEPEMLGGLLADDMGLGKSLIIIAAILSTIQSAVTFTAKAFTFASQTVHEIVPSKATLILVPSACSSNGSNVLQSQG